jgi:hypothetical protein
LEDHWRYAGSVLSKADVDADFAWSWPATTPVYKDGIRQLLSAKEASNLAGLTVLYQQITYSDSSPEEEQPPSLEEATPVVLYSEMPFFFQGWVKQHLHKGGFKDARIINDTWLAVTLAPESTTLTYEGCVFWSTESDTIYVARIGMFGSGPSLINKKHPLGRWLQAVFDASTTQHSVISHEMALAAIKHTASPHSFHDAERFLEKWRQIPNMPSHLLPPEGISLDTLIVEILNIRD